MSRAALVAVGDLPDLPPEPEQPRRLPRWYGPAMLAGLALLGAAAVGLSLRPEPDMLHARRVDRGDVPAVTVSAPPTTPIVPPLILPPAAASDGGSPPVLIPVPVLVPTPVAPTTPPTTPPTVPERCVVRVGTRCVVGALPGP